ncbi:transcriptional regulator [Aureimonas endophytica]|uniref:Transcriptional regulator n=1 Tax=Aureimonas endophytica TaxID=2027858 RepID=A0A917E255_9HYPH|nr:LysR substrate-binding domain-containing protein [Aureimonas endophytica]GGD91660.1 transcriptional regulator [Aureimonas endophytica]
MRRRLPPLNAVKAFECAGRLGSFAAAGAELGVTHGAISRQVAILEDWLGLRLFVKHGRGLALTTAGRQFLVEATGLLDGLAAASEAMTWRHGSRLLRVNAPQTFTMRWLIPRLPSFAALYPEVEIRLSASIAPVETIADRFDIAIRRGAMGAASTPFLAETCVPVASPSLPADRPVVQLRDLDAHTLLHAESVAHLWPDWLRQANCPDVRGRSQLRFEPLYHSLQAAIDGVDIAIGPSALVASDIAQGRLVPLFPDRPMGMADFHLLVAPGRDAGRRRLAFRNWIETAGLGPHDSIAAAGRFTS